VGSATIFSKPLRMLEIWPLMHQVESFKMTENGQESHARSSAATTAHRLGLTAAGSVKKPLFKKSAASSKEDVNQELAVVVVGNGKDHRQKDSEFEEF
jgi:hypothetical protein